MYFEYTKLKKNRSRKSATQKKKEDLFLTKLSDLVLPNWLRRKKSVLTHITSDEYKSDEVDHDGNNNDPDFKTARRSTKNSRKPISHDLAAIFDRCKISNRSASLILALSPDKPCLSSSRESIRKTRQKSREVHGRLAREEIKIDDVLTVHWNTKQMKNFSDKVERLIVYVSGKGKL